MTNINLNGIEYVPKEEYDKLKLEKDKKPEANNLDYAILDPVNVCGIVPFHKEVDLDSDYIELPNGLNQTAGGVFKRLPLDLIRVGIDHNLNLNDSLFLSKSKYSTIYIKNTQKTAKHLFNDDAEFYLRFDKEKNEYIEHQPCLIKYNRLVFILAPRVESDE
jgi:hypothetical protein